MNEKDKQDGAVLYKDLSYEIVAAAIQVWKVLGYGFLEKVYENALTIELVSAGSLASSRSPSKYSTRAKLREIISRM
jgi:GxxExxY protein